MDDEVWYQKKISPHYMNSVLVELWDGFNIPADNMIRDTFAKTKLPPLISTDLTTNTQACAAYIQVSSGSEDEEINNAV